MTSSNFNKGLLFDRKFLMKSIIIRIADDLYDCGLQNFDYTMEWLGDACEEGIVKKQLLREIELQFSDANDNILSVLSACIDWETHELRIKSGDGVVFLDRHLTKDANNQPEDFTIKSISTKLEVLRETMIGMGDFLNWQRIDALVYLKNDINQSDASYFCYVCDCKLVSEQNIKKKAEFALKINVEPDALNELKVCFKSVRRNIS